MRHKPHTATSKSLDVARMQIVEPAFGWIESARGIRKLQLRGWEMVRTEWQLICLIHNILENWRHTWRLGARRGYG